MRFIILLSFFILNTNAFAITVSSLAELKSYQDSSNVNITMTPGTYTFDTNNCGTGKLFANPTLILILGSNCTYDFTGVKFNFDTNIFTAFGSVEVIEFQLVGKKNVVKNLTMEDIGNTVPTKTILCLSLDGEDNLMEGFKATTRGSYPYGYGDIFGKGSDNVIGHHKHGALQFRGIRNHAKNCSFYLRSYGHGIFIQGAVDALVEGCYVEGELRTTDAVLAEAGTGSPADKVNFMSVWGYKVQPGWIFSCQEDGIRCYASGCVYPDCTVESTTGNVSVIGCTVRNMRSGVTIGWAKGTKYVENCTVIGNECGFWTGSSANVVNCRGDASVGPLYSEDLASSNSKIDLTLIDGDIKKYGNTPMIYMAGTGHTITLKDSSTTYDPKFEFLVGGTRLGHRWLAGSGEEPPYFNAKSIAINNYTQYPLILGANSSYCSGQSAGMITNLGSYNTVTHLAMSVLNIEAENYKAMSGVSKDTTTDVNAGYKIGSIDVGDGMDYEISVPFTGTYSLDYRVSSASAAGGFTVGEGATTLEQISFTTTSGEQVWKTVRSTAPIYLTQGVHTIRIVATSAGWNLNWMKLLQECKEISIVPYLETFNSQGETEGVQQNKTVTIFNGNKLVLQPQPAVGGKWSWTGPTNFSASSRLVTLASSNKLQTGKYAVTFTNDCGLQTKDTFTVSVFDSILVEAENYKTMSGISTETTTDSGAGLNVTDISQNDWMDYEINVPFTATYTLDYRIASATACNFTLSSGTTTLDNISFATTGGAQNWATISSAKVIYLKAGLQTLRIKSGSADWKFNWIKLNAHQLVRACSMPYSNSSFTVSNKAVEWTSGAMDISCVSGVNIYADVQGLGTMGATDSLNLYYRVDGGELIPFSKNTGAFDKKMVWIKNINGSIIELVIKGSTNSSAKTYTISNVYIFHGTDQFAKIEAETYNSNNGTVSQTTSDTGGGQNVGTIKNDNWLKFNTLDFTNVNSIDLRLSSIYTASTVELRIDSVAGKLLGTVVVPNTTNWQKWATVNTLITKTDGLHDFYLVFKSTASYVCNINWFQFVESTNTSIGEVKLANDNLQMYPNPVSGNLTIKNNENSNLEIYNIAGKCIYQTQSAGINYIVNMSGFANDIYFVKMTNSKGVRTGKIIKQ